MAALALEVEGLRVVRSGADIDIVTGVSFSLQSGAVLGLVGESGSGKTTAGLALLGHCRRGLSIATGSRISVAGQRLDALGPQEMRTLRGSTICYVPQDPNSALNPALRLRTQLAECGGRGGHLSEDRLEALLGEVNLPATAAFLDRYPHQISGGQQQRIAIAMAFSARPRVIVMDEPTTALDVTTQAHVLAIFRRMCERHDVAAVYISHDLAVVASIAHRVAVMYAGRIVEDGPVEEVLRHPRHPYTRALIAAVPDPDSHRALHGIAGQAPEPDARPKGCSFAARCPHAMPACEADVPPQRLASPGHSVSCLLTSLDRLASVPPSAKQMPANTEQPLIEVVNLEAFHGRRQILHDVNLSLRRRQCLAIVGQSGSGKTTLARCIAGLHPQFAGALRFGGQELPAASRDRPATLRRQIQYVFQNP